MTDNQTDNGASPNLIQGLAKPDTERDRPAWEKPGNKMRAFFLTLGQVIFSPGRTFARPAQPGLGRPLLFALLCLAPLAILAPLAWQFVATPELHCLFSLKQVTIICLFLMLEFITRTFLDAAIMQLGLLLLKSGQGWAASLRPLLYLNAISGCGLLYLLGIAVFFPEWSAPLMLIPALIAIWSLLASVYALSASHGVSKAVVMGAALLGTTIFYGLIFTAGMLMAA